MSPHWRRNLFAVTAATFIGFAGFTLVMPFLPLYFAELGVTDVGHVALWTGLSLGVTPGITALLAPLWGRLADRFGPKLMVLRSLASFVVVMVMMGSVTRPWQVLALRAVQGLFAGYGALALTMAADSAPAGRMGSAIGTVQIAQRLGPALGPVIGGVLAQIVGLRRAFLVSACFYAVGFVLVLAGYHEPPGRRGSFRAADRNGTGVSFSSVLSLQNFLLLMVVVLGVQFVDRSVGPILPLLVERMGTPGDRVPIVAGTAFTLAAFGGAVGNYLCARLLQRARPRALIAAAAALGGAAALAPVVMPGVVVLSVAMFFFGMSTGSALTASYTAAASLFPVEARGTGFGLLTSASLIGLATSPIVSGFLGATSMRGVFILDAVLLAILGSLVSRVMVERGLRAERPVVEDG